MVRTKESLDVEDGGSMMAMGSRKSSVVGSLKGAAQDASPVEDSTPGHLELAFN